MRMRLNRRGSVRSASALFAVVVAVPLVAVSGATAGTGEPTHRKGHGWAPITVCDPAGRPPYTYTIEIGPASSLDDRKGYVAYANRTFKYYTGFKQGRITVTDAPAKPTEVGGLHYAEGHNNDPLTARVVDGPQCAR
jgi:hypothetical protein